MTRWHVSVSASSPCFRFLPVVALSGSLSPPNPSPARSKDRSTSSENRSMTPNTLDSDVPPLKSNPAGGSGRVKIRLSVQQTQKSFSMIASGQCATARGRHEQVGPVGDR